MVWSVVSASVAQLQFVVWLLYVASWRSWSWSCAPLAVWALASCGGSCLASWRRSIVCVVCGYNTANETAV